MKKILTLIAFAVATLVANAATPIGTSFNAAKKSQGGSGETLEVGQKLDIVFGNVDADGTLTEAGNWWYQSGNLVAPTSTDYTMLVLQFAELSTDATISLYGPWYEEPEGSGNWVAGHIDIKIPAGSSFVAFEIAEAVALANFNWEYATMVISAKPGEKAALAYASFMTDADFDKLVNAEAATEKVKDLALPGENGVVIMDAASGSGWYSPGWNGLTDLNALYKTLVFEVESSDSRFQLMVQGADNPNDWNQEGFTTFKVAQVTSPAVIALPVEGKHIHLGQFAFQNMNIIDEFTYMDPATGELVQESEYGPNKVVVTRVYLTSNVVESNYPADEDPEAISNVTVNGKTNGMMFNLAGQRVNANVKGIVIMNGKKMIRK